MPKIKIFLPGKRLLVVYLAFLSAFAPISTDMYLPALPALSREFHTTNDLTSYTISAFLLLFALSMLFWGPLSDRYGRKPVLFAGSLIYIASSIGCALSGNIFTLLGWRCVQAIGSGAASTLALAIVKDTIRGASMEKIVSILQAFVIIAPITAPVLGGWLLLYINWRGIFWCLTFCGIISLAGAILLRETSHINRNISLVKNFHAMRHILSRRNFLFPLIIFSSLAMPFMAYLALSSFIFQDIFNETAQNFSLFFALLAFISLGGPLFHMLFMRKFKRNITLCYYIFFMLAGGMGILLLGENGPWWFTIFFAFISFFGSAIRPPSTVLMMEIIKGNNGIVSSLINCGGLLCGSFSMYLTTLPVWSGPVIAVGAIAAITCFVALICWILIKNFYPENSL